jgi:diacylglycerol O-acyltransferase
VLAVIAGAVRTWLDTGLGPVGGVRVKVPVSLHHDGEADAIGNRDSYFFVDLPVAEADPTKRVLAINRETRERKLHRDAETLYRLGMHPFVAHWAMSPRVFTFNVSNVRGPAADIYVLGARVRELYSLAEIAQHHALRVAVISAAGYLSFGLCADRDVVRDLETLADGLRRATDELLRC